MGRPAKFLVDTHAFVWLLGNPSRIPAATLDELADRTNTIFESAVTFWE